MQGSPVGVQDFYAHTSSPPMPTQMDHIFISIPTGGSLLREGGSKSPRGWIYNSVQIARSIPKSAHNRRKCLFSPGVLEKIQLGVAKLQVS